MRSRRPCRSSASIARPDSASRWAVGSSSRITSAPVRSVRATARRWRSPPLRKAPPGPIRVSRPCSSRPISGPRPTAARASCSRGSASPPRWPSGSPSSRLPRMVESKRCASCGHQAARPLSRIWPPAAGRKPRTTASRVDFPEPEAPVTASQRPGSAVAVRPVKTGGPPGQAAARSRSSIPGLPPGLPATGTRPPDSPAAASSASSRTPASPIRAQHGPQRRVLADRRRDGRVGFHERELQQHHDGDRGGLDGAAEGQRGGQHGAGQGGGPAGQHRQALAEPFGPRRALGGGGRGAVGAGDGGEHRGGDAVGVEFGAGVEGRRDLAEDAGAQPLLGPGGHPVRGQRQGGGRHEAHQGGRDARRAARPAAAARCR